MLLRSTAMCKPVTCLDKNDTDDNADNEDDDHNAGQRDDYNERRVCTRTIHRYITGAVESQQLVMYWCITTARGPPF